MKIVIPDDYHGLVPQLDSFSKLSGHDVTVLRDAAPSFETLVAKLRDAEIIVAIRERTDFTRALLEQLPKLKLIAQTGRSAHSVDLEACTDLGIAVCAGSHASPFTVAEHTWALIFASVRRVAEDAALMKQGQWRDSFSTSLRGKTLGVYGLGRIGEPVAAAGAAFGMRVLCYGREATAARAQALGYDAADSKTEFFAQSDILSVNLRMLEATRGIITAADLALMKPTALIVNTSRAELFAPGALVDALAQRPPGFRRHRRLRKRAGTKRRSSLAENAKRDLHAAQRVAGALYLRTLFRRSIWTGCRVCRGQAGQAAESASGAAPVTAAFRPSFSLTLQRRVVIIPLCRVLHLAFAVSIRETHPEDACPPAQNQASALAPNCWSIHCCCTAPTSVSVYPANPISRCWMHCTM